MLIIDRHNISEYIRNIFTKYYELTQKKYTYLLKEAPVKKNKNKLSTINPEIVKGVIYKSIAEAEWDIFKRRWFLLTGIKVTVEDPKL